MNIENWFKSINKYEVVGETIEFCDPASTLEIDEFESAFSISVPELRSIWLIANGESSTSEGIFGGFQLLSIEESKDTIENNLSLLSDGETLKAEEFDSFLGKTSIFENGWIPFGGLFNRHLLILDARDKTKRPVFEWSLELGPGRLIGNDLLDFLVSVREQLLSQDFIGDLDELK